MFNEMMSQVKLPMYLEAIGVLLLGLGVFIISVRLSMLLGNVSKVQTIMNALLPKVSQGKKDEDG